MLIAPNRKAELSDAQFETLTRVVDYRGDDVARRFVDTRTVLTLTALAKRSYVTLTWGPVDGRPRGITGAVVTNAGLNVLVREQARRAAVAEYDAAIAATRRPAELVIVQGGADEPAQVRGTRSIVSRMDPFEVIRTGNREVAIPF